MERLINTADEAVEIKESREDKGHTGDLRMRGKTPERERERAAEQPMRRAAAG